MWYNLNDLYLNRTKMNMHRYLITAILSFLTIFLPVIMFQAPAVFADAPKEIIWVMDGGNGQIVKISPSRDKKLIQLKEHFCPGAIALDPNDGSLWINTICESVDYKQVIKISSEGEELARFGRYEEVDDGVVNPANGSYWVADEGGGCVAEISRDGKKELKRIVFEEPEDVKVSSYDGSIWVSDKEGYKVVKLSPEGRKLTQKRGVGIPHHMAINPIDGTCWVTDELNARVIKLSADGKEILATVEGLVNPFMLSIDQRDGAIWVTDQGAGEVLKVAADGKKIVERVKGLKQPRGISSVNPKDGSFWVTDWWGNVVKFSSLGEKLEEISGFTNPYFIQVDWKE